MTINHFDCNSISLIYQVDSHFSVKKLFNSGMICLSLFIFGLFAKFKKTLSS